MNSGAKFTKLCKTNLCQCYDIPKVYGRFTIKCDLQRTVRESCEKVTRKRDGSLAVIRQYQACSNYFNFSLVYNFHILP